jgi:nitrate reductase gamma subunit
VRPSWDDVLVKVISNTGTGNFTLVHANVEALRLGNLAQNLHCLLGQLSHFTGFLWSRLIEVWNVSVGANQQVPRVVRKKI